MVEKKMILIAKKHDTWVDIVCTFGCNRVTAEDIVQEMYIKVFLKLQKGLDIMYEDEINYYYIFKTLKTLFIDLKRKGKNITIVTLDNIHLTNEDVNYIESYEKIKNELNKMYWYDKQVFNIINSGESIAEFSRRSHIRYYSLYNTYKKVKEKLKKVL
jgi:hypothetical protein|tara:strand:+ start:261 stop:734 length:474 start_codon:yes stop_codon:yes gene_type:complete